MLAILIVGGLALPAVAHAQGNSSIDQYTEEIPSAGGDDSAGSNAGTGGVVPGSGGRGGGGSQPAAPAVTPTTPATPDEAAASNLAQSTAPAPADGTHGDSGSADSEAGPVASGQAAAATLDRDSGSGDGFNLLWPIIFGASLLLAIAWAVGRHLHQRAQDGVGSPA